MHKKHLLIVLTCLCYHFSAGAQLNFSKFAEEWQQFSGNPKDLEIEAEFALLESFSDRQMARMRPFIEGIDRFPEWVPFRENRVQLADGTEMSASYIEAGCERFIASQAPMQENRLLFWQMVWEQGIEQIVMTTELLDVDGDELATAYWPEKKSLLLANGMEIELIEERWLFPENFEKVQIRKFLLRNQDQTRLVTHYWYRNWLDNCLPEREKLLALVEAVHKDKKSEARVLAHCAAGVGRTGVFISVYHMLHNADPLEPFELVARLRWQRPEMVGVLEQYAFCCQIWEQIQASCAPPHLNQLDDIFPRK